jgi:hypothetical protein
MNSGSHTYPDGSRYEGEWLNGKRHGQGRWSRLDGTIYSGEWKSDKPDGQGTLTLPDGKKYTGGWKVGQQHGPGVVIQPDGTKRFGEWEEGKLLAEKRPVTEKDKQNLAPNIINRDNREEPVEIKIHQADLKHHITRTEPTSTKEKQHYKPAAAKRQRRKPILLKSIILPLILVVVLLTVGAFFFISTGGDDAYAASGRVVNYKGEGLAGVTIDFGEEHGTSNTDENGYWSKSNLHGEVTVTPRYGNALFIPVKIELITGTADTNFQLVSESVTGSTSPSGEFTFLSPLGIKKGRTIDIYVEDIVDKNGLGDIDIEVIVSENLLEIFAYDSSGQYLPEILVIDLNNTGEHPEVVLKDNPGLVITIGLLATAVKTYGLYKFAAGGIAIVQGAVKAPFMAKVIMLGFKNIGMPKLLMGGLKELGIAIAGEALKATFEYLVEGQSTKNPVTVFVFENQEDTDAFATIKVPAGASKEEIVEAVKSVTGEAVIEILAPAENPAGAYYNADGTPKFFLVYLKEPTQEHAADEEQQPEEEPESDQEPTVIVNVEVLRLRSGPSTDHDILDRLTLGTLLQVIGSKNEWLQVITPGGKEGWVHSDYVTTQSDDQQGPIASSGAPEPYSGQEFGLESLGLREHMSVEEVVAIMGAPLERKETEYEVHLEPEMYLTYEGLLLGFYSDHLVFYEITTTSIVSSRGIRVGDTAESVIRKYPHKDAKEVAECSDKYKCVELYYIDMGDDADMGDDVAMGGGYHRDQNTGKICEIYYWYGAPATCAGIGVNYIVENGLVKSITWR